MAVVNVLMLAGAVGLYGRVCLTPLGNLNRFSETFFFKAARSAEGKTEVVVEVAVGVAVGVVVGGDFSTLPWLSLRNGGGSHFLPGNPRRLFPGELVFAAHPSFAIILSVSSGNTGGTTFCMDNPDGVAPAATDVEDPAVPAADDDTPVATPGLNEMF